MRRIVISDLANLAECFAQFRKTKLITRYLVVMLVEQDLKVKSGKIDLISI